MRLMRNQKQTSGGCSFTSQEAAMKAASFQDAFAGLGFGIGATRRRRATRGRAPALSPVLTEALEWRKLLSVLTINGTNFDDTIKVYESLAGTTKQIFYKVDTINNNQPSGPYTGVTDVD